MDSGKHPREGPAASSDSGAASSDSGAAPEYPPQENTIDQNHDYNFGDYNMDDYNMDDFNIDDFVNYGNYINSDECGYEPGSNYAYHSSATDPLIQNNTPPSFNNQLPPPNNAQCPSNDNQIVPPYNPASNSAHAIPATTASNLLPRHQNPDLLRPTISDYEVQNTRASPNLFSSNPAMTAPAGPSGINNPPARSIPVSSLIQSSPGPPTNSESASDSGPTDLSTSRYRGFFANYDEAMAYLKKPKWMPKIPDDTVPTSPAAQQAYHRRLCDALVSLNSVKDRSASRSLKFFRESCPEPIDVEAACWILLDEVIKLHQCGFMAILMRRPAYYNMEMTCKERLEFIIQLLRDWKAIALPVVELNSSVVRNIVAAPKVALRIAARKKD